VARSRIITNTAVIVSPLILGILLAASNFTLARENRRLSGLAHYYASLRHTPEGAVLPELHGKDPDGRDLTISNKDVSQDTLLLVFSPTCPHCKRNWPVWLDLARGAVGQRVVFVNVGGPLPANFAQLYSFDHATVMAETSPETILRYSFLETPITVVMTPDGRSEKVLGGELGATDVAAIRKILTTSQAEGGVH